MWQIIRDLLHVRQMRRQIIDLTSERDWLTSDRSRLIEQLFREINR